MGISKKRHLKFWSHPPCFFFVFFSVEFGLKWIFLPCWAKKSHVLFISFSFSFLFLFWSVIAKKSVFQIPKILRIESVSKFFIDCILTLCQPVKVYTFSTYILTTLIINLEEFKYDTIIYCYYWSHKNKLKIIRILRFTFFSLVPLLFHMHWCIQQIKTL